jgi:hypothetical protein
MRSTTPSFALASALLVSSRGTAGAEPKYVNSELPWHDAVLDSQGKLLAWYRSEKN